MNSPNKIALPLVVALNALTLSMAFTTDAFAADTAASQPSNATAATASTQVSASQAPPSQSTTAKTTPPKKSVAANPAPKTADTKPAKTPVASPGSGAFVQSALNSVDELVRSDGSPKGGNAKKSVNALGTHQTDDLVLTTPTKAGTIDEQVYEDGRREERVHTLGDSSYCVTFESPTDPKDGIDKMQYGLHPGGMSNGASIHSCGHRFDQ